MNLIDYLSIESCRICKEIIVPQYSSAFTLCNECWSILAQQEAHLDFCEVPRFGEMVVAHAVIYESTVKTLTYKLKYDDDRLIAKDLGRFLANAYHRLTNEEPAFNENLTLIPIPLSFWRKLKRGFNQAELLAVELRKAMSLKVDTKILQRKKNTKAQHDLNREERRLNLQSAFLAHKTTIEPGVKFLLIDDIHTSGATLAEAAHTLYMAGAAKVAALTVSRALLREDIGRYGNAGLQKTAH